MLTAITRKVSRSLEACELTWHTRRPIDLARARRQHHDYELALSALGLRVISLPEQPDMPDAVFVEDPLLVFDELAVACRMGAPARRPETESLVDAIAPFRPVHRLREPATLDGGDVMRIGRDVFVGLSTRTSQAGIAQLTEALAPHHYRVIPVQVTGCLHLKSACCSLGDGKILANPLWLDTDPLRDYTLLEVPAAEPDAANVLRLGDTILMPAAFPRTEARLRAEGLQVKTLDISELMKAEAAITCSSLIFKTPAPGVS